MRECSCGGSNDGRDRGRRLGLGLVLSAGGNRGGLLLLERGGLGNGLSRSLGGRVLEGRNGSGLLNLRRRLLSLGRGDLRLRLGLEEVADAGGETAADLSRAGLLLPGLDILLHLVLSKR